MPFHKIENSTTMDSADVNSNYLHVGQGSRLPYDNSGSMSAMDSTYDLGSSATAWKDLYCNDIPDSRVIVGGNWEYITQLEGTDGEWNESVVLSREYKQIDILYFLRFTPQSVPGDIRLNVNSITLSDYSAIIGDYTDILGPTGTANATSSSAGYIGITEVPALGAIDTYISGRVSGSIKSGEVKTLNVNYMTTSFGGPFHKTTEKVYLIDDPIGTVTNLDFKIAVTASAHYHNVLIYGKR